MKSLTAQGTEQIWPSWSGQEASGQGGRAPASWGEVSPREKLMPPVEVRSSSRLDDSAEVMSSMACARVEELVEMWCGRSDSSSEVEAELIAQSVSLSSEKLQSLRPRRRRVPERPGREPRAGVEPEGCSESISGVGERRYSVLRKAEAL